MPCKPGEPEGVAHGQGVVPGLLDLDRGRAELEVEADGDLDSAEAGGPGAGGPAGSGCQVGQGLDSAAAVEIHDHHPVLERRTGAPCLRQGAHGKAQQVGSEVAVVRVAAVLAPVVG